MVTVTLSFDLKVMSKMVKKRQILKFKVLDKTHKILIQFCPGFSIMYLVLVYDIYKSPKNVI